MRAFYWHGSDQSVRLQREVQRITTTRLTGMQTRISLRQTGDSDVQLRLRQGEGQAHESLECAADAEARAGRDTHPQTFGQCRQRSCFGTGQLGPQG